MYWYKTDFQLLPRCGLAELKTPGQRGAVPSSRDPPHSSFEHLVNPLDPQKTNGWDASPKGWNRSKCFKENVLHVIMNATHSTSHWNEGLKSRSWKTDRPTRNAALSSFEDLSPLSLSAVGSSYATISLTS